MPKVPALLHDTPVRRPARGAAWRNTAIRLDDREYEVHRPVSGIELCRTERIYPPQLAGTGRTARRSTEAAQAGTNLKPAFGPEKNKAAIPCFTLRRFSEPLHTTGCRSVRGRAAFTDRSP